MLAHDVHQAFGYLVVLVTRFLQLEPLAHRFVLVLLQDCASTLLLNVLFEETFAVVLKINFVRIIVLHYCLNVYFLHGRVCLEVSYLEIAILLVQRLVLLLLDHKVLDVDEFAEGFGQVNLIDALLKLCHSFVVAAGHVDFHYKILLLDPLYFVAEDIAA